MRRANAIDFWRGLALIMIFIDHIPGNVFAYLTMRNFAISDAAELFVFLAGWSLSYATGGPSAPEPWHRTVFRLVSRAIELYRAQLMITMLALALLATTAMVRNNTIYLEWHNAGPAFYDPVRATIGTVLLTYQLGYFNILPVYVILLLMAPPFILLARFNPILGCALAFAVYAFALVTRVSFPSWPAEEPWYLNPLSWQILLALGFLAAESARRSEAFAVRAKSLILPAAAIVLAGLVVTRLQYAPDPMAVPEPRLLFVFDKTYLSPARLISLIAIAIAFHHIYQMIAESIWPITRLLCGLGRNSLAVFCVLSLAALVGQILRFINDDSLLLDAVIVLSGIGLMGFTAWFVEWRNRSPRLQQQPGSS